MKVIPLVKPEKITARERLDKLLLEAHLRDVYGVEEWVEYEALLNYIETLESQLEGTNKWQSS
jgi:hypothetical protein